MKQDVIISILARQEFDGESDEIQLKTQGTLETIDAGFKITYQETEMTGLEGTTTIFLVTAESVSLIRAGTVNTQMVFQEGRRHVSLYDTPYGTMDVKVHTHFLKESIDGSGGTLEMQYDIEIDHLAVGKNYFDIKVELPKDNQNRKK